MRIDSDHGCRFLPSLRTVVSGPPAVGTIAVNLEGVTTDGSAPRFRAFRSTGKLSRLPCRSMYRSADTPPGGRARRIPPNEWRKRILAADREKELENRFPEDPGTDLGPPVGVISCDADELCVRGRGTEATWGPRMLARSTLASMSVESPQPAQGRSSFLPWLGGARRPHQSRRPCGFPPIPFASRAGALEIAVGQPRRSWIRAYESELLVQKP